MLAGLIGGAIVGAVVIVVSVVAKGILFPALPGITNFSASYSNETLTVTFGVAYNSVQLTGPAHILVDMNEVGTSPLPSVGMGIGFRKDLILSNGLHSVGVRIFAADGRSYTQVKNLTA